MGIKGKIDRDLKSALLSGDKDLATMLRGLKSALLYAEVDTGKREEGLSEAETIQVLRKEAKKCQESAELFKQGGNQSKAAAELTELHVIEQYLPAQLSDQDLKTLIEQAIQEANDASLQAMGKIIGRVKELSKGQADGGRIAGMVKQQLSNRQE